MKALFALVLSALLFGAAGLARAELLGAELRVNGLACPFCAFGIEKKLLAVDGVETVEVLLDEGRVELAFTSGNKATIQQLHEAVAGAGFEVAELRVEARGRLLGDAETPVLEVAPGLRLRLRFEEGAEPGLARLDPDSGPWTVSGEVREGGSPPDLLVRSARPNP